MKTTIFACLLLAFLFPRLASSTVRTVSNYAPLPAQYTDINAAIGASANDDTIYIHGTPVYYNMTVYLSKRLTLIGNGYHPNTDFPYGTSVATISLYVAGNGSTISGMAVGSVDMPGGAASDTISNIRILNCYISGSGLLIPKNYNSFLIENCIFAQPINGLLAAYPATYQSGLVIRNCIFSNTVIQVKAGTLVDHCIFIGNNTGIHAFQNCSNTTFSNNIFFGRNIAASDASGCVFNNNLAFQCSNNTLPQGSNSGTGNIAGTDPQFLNFPSPPASFDYAHNYRLAAASPGHLAATDGTDLGIYGNNFTFSMTGEPTSVPVMRKLDIYNTTVPFNGTLDIRYKSSVPVKD